jgi:hypothetical protein
MLNHRQHGRPLCEMLSVISYKRKMVTADFIAAKGGAVVLLTGESLPVTFMRPDLIICYQKESHYV